MTDLAAIGGSLQSGPYGRPEATSTVIVKLGGSLLTLPDLFSRLFSVLRQSAVARPVIVVGGGEGADQIRNLQRRMGFNDATAHRMAISAMTSNARHLQRLDRRLCVISTRDEFRRSHQQGLIPLLDAETFLHNEERDPAIASPGPAPQSWEQPLPALWSVTSDSIAAWVAARWPASELWMLKSCDRPCDNSTGDRRDAPVDEAFARMRSPSVRLRWFNLRTL